MTRSPRSELTAFSLYKARVLLVEAVAHEFCVATIGRCHNTER
jgi:hypothetical protein